MKASWLIQRLEKPHGPLFGRFVDNPFSFGGGYRNGGLSSEAMDLLRGIFTFEYMGAAEFEFGAVPEALNKIAQVAAKDGLSASWFDIALTDVKKSWRKDAPKVYKGDSGRIYLLVSKADTFETIAMIRQVAAGELRLKESSNLDLVLRPDGYLEPRTCGWLELDNGFMFFTDREMWAKAAALFGVQVLDSD